MAKKVYTRNRPTYDPDIWVKLHRHKIIIIDMFMEINKNVKRELVYVKKHNFMWET